VVGSIFEGLLYTGLSAAGDGYGVVANLMQTGINAIQAAGSGNNLLGSFNGKVSALESQLASAVTAVTKSLGQQETVILQDWWKMQQVYALTKLPITDPNSLAWPATTSGDLLQALVPGYNVSVLQMLMPALYKICRWLQIPSGQSVTTNAPSYAKWSESQPGNVTSYYEVSQGEESGYPSSALMDMVWGNGVRPANFYQRSGGWNQFNNSEMGWYPSQQAGPHLCNMLVINFVNYTGNALAITVKGADYNCLSWNFYIAGPAAASGTATVPAYGELSVALWTNISAQNDISGNVSISANQSQVLTMDFKQDWCLMNAGNVSVSPSSGGGSQNFSYTSDCTAGAYKDDRWGSIEVYISQ
jgi:hypothetical protein